jgi:type I restriction enzyme M protein
MTPLRTITPVRLADGLHEQVYACGASGYIIPLTAVATVNTLLGVPGMLAPTLRTLAFRKDAAGWVRKLWAGMTVAFPYLDGRVSALTGWLDEPQDHEAAALTECFRVLAAYDMPGSFDQAKGDLLGPLYMMLRGKRDKQVTGAFYTPMDVSDFMADILYATEDREETAPGDARYGAEDVAALSLLSLGRLKEGSSVADPCCGSGGMVLAAARAMRRAGLDPGTCTWALNDIDPTAVAMAGVNMASHGLRKVILTCGNGLLLGTGLADDPLVAAGYASADAGEAA